MLVVKKVFSSAYDPLNFDVDPDPDAGPHWEKKWIRIRIQVISLRSTIFLKTKIIFKFFVLFFRLFLS